MKPNRLMYIAIAASLVCVSAGAAPASSDDGKVHPIAATKKAGKAVGHGVKKASKDIGHGFRDGGRAVGHAARDTTRKVGHAFRDAGK